jgi:hypothetical protein
MRLSAVPRGDRSPSPSFLPKPRATLSVVITLLAVVGGGCIVRSETIDPRTLSSVEEEQNGVVAIGTSLGDSDHVTLCSGALVAPNLVLTARHCVSKSLTSTPSCDARGRSHNGDHLADDVDPAMVSIYVGQHVRVDRDRPRAHGIRTLHPKGQVLCDADLAFLVLDRPLVGVEILPLRLDAPVASGDTVMPVGFGGGTAMTIGDRVPRKPSTVLAIGPSANSDTGAVLGPREFEVDHATCRGDSGGPALDARTGEVVGVVSRGGSCLADGNHVYTRVDAYAGLATEAFRWAERSARESVAANR